MLKVILICRAPQFSPNSETKDSAILHAVGACLLLKGCEVRYIQETDFTLEDEADAYLSMGRLPKTLDLLRRKESQGCCVINNSDGVARMRRSVLDKLMRDRGIPVAPLMSEHEACGYWLKRGDAAVQSRDDVLYVRSREEVYQQLSLFHHRGVNDVIVTEHVAGDLVKFYGVQGTGFFRYFYPTDDGDTKFDDEKRNGEAHHYPFIVDELKENAERVAQMTGVCVYGGDAIVNSNGAFVIIDFNDWPSYSRCREEAAEVITDTLLAQHRSRRQ